MNYVVPYIVELMDPGGCQMSKLIFKSVVTSDQLKFIIQNMKHKDISISSTLQNEAYYHSDSVLIICDGVDLKYSKEEFSDSDIPYLEFDDIISLLQATKPVEINIKPFEPILGRDDSDEVWTPHFYAGRYDEEDRSFLTIDGAISHMIKYEDNEDLLYDVRKPKSGYWSFNDDNIPQFKKWKD